MNYIVLDVETANHDYSSICQIGLVAVKNNKIIGKKSWLIDPQCDFRKINTSIHGINQKKVIGKPYFPEVFLTIQSVFESCVVVHHSPFDRIAIKRATERYEIVTNNILFVDNMVMAQSHWQDLNSYGLVELANRIDFDFKHHDALQDALAAQAIFRTIMEESKETFPQLVKRACVDIFSIPATPSNKTKLPIRELKKHEDSNTEGKYFGKFIAFTGDLLIPRPDAAKLARKAGFTVKNSVSSKTDFLCVGIPDVTKFAIGHNKSSKQRKAEELIQQGHSIEIICEDDFLKMCSDFSI